MRNLLALLFSCFIFTASFSQRNNYWQQKADYTLQVQLDDILHSLDGYEKIVYTNNSPDTLHFIWFHLWPNAYKNDKTAFSEQLLRNGRTDFYFSDEESKGYISHLAFKVNDIKADTQQHPQYIDVVKLILPEPLLPGGIDTITTPFHVKIPYSFSRGGHIGQSYQITQWYPKPAVYDSKGWHPMPYLDQGEFYSEFGNYDVKITLPDNYIVAASGVLQSKGELKKLLDIAAIKPAKQVNTAYYKKQVAIKRMTPIKLQELFAARSSGITKTLNYQISNAHDFAWFASKQFLVQHDTVRLQNRIVDVFSYFPPWAVFGWTTSVDFAKTGLKYYDTHLGSYPYSTASVVSGPQAIGSGGMEYPSITLITTQSDGEELDRTIAHELGHNWFYGALASNERDHAWMDEGMNSFYEKNYVKEKYAATNKEEGTDENIEASLIKNLEKLHKDQPIDIRSDSFTSVNYGLFVYTKTALWMQRLKQQIGGELFDKSMKSYYAKWQFKHPYPENFQQSIELESGTKIDSLMSELTTTSAQRPNGIARKQIKLKLQYYSLKNTDKYQYISVAPMLGGNAYDKLMVGGIIHNYQFPFSKFNFLAIPLYATATQRFNYYARASYRILVSKGVFESININSSVSDFSYKHINFSDSLYPAQYNLKFFKVEPTIRFNIRNSNLLSSVKQFIQLKSFFITEQDYTSKSVKFNASSFDSSYLSSSDRHLVQLRYHLENYRALYPYNLDVTVDANENFLRTGLTGNYFFNYPEGKSHGLNIRFFAGKFFHLNQSNPYNDYRYFLTLTGPRGEEDYTYSNYFIGRGDFDGVNSQQLMERDGFFKVETELQGQVGKTDRWLSALNFSGDIPNKVNLFNILPIKLPIKFFLDIGTYAEAWNENVTTSRFLYDAGLQLSLFNSYLNVYVPIVYSKVYRDYYKSIFPGKSFGKSISFSIDIQKIKLIQLAKGIPL